MRFLPRSLLARVFALYALTLVGVALLGVLVYLGIQVQRQLSDTRHDTQVLLELVAPVARDSAVIGDYDTIRRQLARLVQHSAIDSATFTDPSGGRLSAHDGDEPVWAPQALQGWMQRQLGRPAVDVAAGGQVYGRIELALAADNLASQVWQQFFGALALAGLGVLLGLVLIRAPLKRWLGPLERIGQLDADLAGGRSLAQAALGSDAPLEFRRTFEVLDRAALSLQEQREQAAATLQAIDDAVLAFGLDGRVRLANDAAQRLLQREAGDVEGQPVTELLPALADAFVADAPAQARWQHRQLLWHDPQGTLHVLDANLSPVLDAAGQRIGQVLACRDVTDQHRRDESIRQLNATRDAALSALRHALEQAERHATQPDASDRSDIEVVSHLVQRLVVRLNEHGEQLDAIFALSPDGFVSFDGEGRVSYCSPGFSTLTGLSADAVRGLETEVFMQRLRQRCDGSAEAQRLARLAPGVPAVQVALQRPRRRVLSLALHAAGSGVVSRMLHLRDITRETEVERMKSEFVAAAAHELRTPMVGIYGYSELLVTRDMPLERARPLLSKIHRQCEVMVAILNEMLDLARMEARQGSDFQFAAVRLEDVVRQSLADWCPPPDREPPRLELAEPPPCASADTTKLQRALRNLLSNAYKYSPQGGPVTVRVLCDEAGGQAGIQVVDQGIGMTPEQLARVGERFYRADESGAVLGTGLGMSLVREIVSLHGGTLQLHSSPGQGTTATVWLPRVTADEEALAPG